MPDTTQQQTQQTQQQQTQQTQTLLGGASSQASQTAATPEQVAEYVKSLPPVVLGTNADGTPDALDPEPVQALAPAFIAAGLKPEQAHGVLQAMATYAQKQNETAEQALARHADELAEATRTELGAELPAFVADASAGGQAIFGEELWGILRAIPAFANDVRVVKALAAHGRSIKTDTGAAGHSAGGPQGTLAERWLKSSTRQT